ncbi:DUF2922 family protein [Enterococcus olivae]
MKKLKLIFLTSEGKRHMFYPHVDNDKITPEEIRKIVEQLIFLDHQNAAGGVHLFDRLEKAVWVEKKEIPLFKKYGNTIIFPKN